MFTRTVSFDSLPTLPAMLAPEGRSSPSRLSPSRGRTSVDSSRAVSAPRGRQASMEPVCAMPGRTVSMKAAGAVAVALQMGSASSFPCTGPLALFCDQDWTLPTVQPAAVVAAVAVPAAPVVSPVSAPVIAVPAKPAAAVAVAAVLPAALSAPAQQVNESGSCRLTTMGRASSIALQLSSGESTLKEWAHDPTLFVIAAAAFGAAFVLPTLLGAMKGDSNNRESAEKLDGTITMAGFLALLLAQVVHGKILVG